MIEIKRDDLRALETYLMALKMGMQSVGGADLTNTFSTLVREVENIEKFVERMAPKAWHHKNCGGEIISVSIDECRLDENGKRHTCEYTFFLKCLKCEKTWGKEDPEELSDIAEWGY